jgi:acyl-CoA thioester hydrolase
MHEARWRVIYGDTDQMGVVYYANYFRFFEAARSEFLRAHGGDYRAMEDQGFLLPVIEATCRYQAPARYDDLLRIPTRITELSRVTLTFEYIVHRDADGKLLCTGKTVHACTGRDGRPRRLPEAVRAWLEPKTE